MRDSATPPIVIDDHGDISLFPTLADAARELEAIDVVESVYEAFDSNGRRLSLAVSEGLVRIWLDPQSVSEPDELLRRLRYFIMRVGPDRIGLDNAETVSLDAAVRALARFFRVT